MIKLHTIMVRVDNVIPDYAQPKFVLKMIHSRLKLNLPAITKFNDELQKNPNAVDEWGNTCLHHATYLRDKELLFRCLKNPKINSLFKNCENLFAHQLISTSDKNFSDLRLLLFARNSLDHWIQEKLESLLLMNPKTDQFTLTSKDEGFQEIVKEIKHQSDQIKKKQIGEDETSHDRELPQEVIYPEYADEKFLLEAFFARMKDAKPTNENANLFATFKETSESDTYLDIKEPEPKSKKRSY